MLGMGNSLRQHHNCMLALHTSPNAQTHSHVRPSPAPSSATTREHGGDPRLCCADEQEPPPCTSQVTLRIPRCHPQLRAWHHRSALLHRLLYGWMPSSEAPPSTTRAPQTLPDGATLASVEAGIVSRGPLTTHHDSHHQERGACTHPHAVSVNLVVTHCPVYMLHQRTARRYDASTPRPRAEPTCHAPRQVQPDCGATWPHLNAVRPVARVEEVM